MNAGQSIQDDWTSIIQGKIGTETHFMETQLARNDNRRKKHDPEHGKINERE